MKWWWKSIKQFFNFYPSEKRGVLILMSTFFILLIFKNTLLNKILKPSEFSLIEKIEILHPSYFDQEPCLNFQDTLTRSMFKQTKLDSNTIKRIIRNSLKYGSYNCIEDLISSAKLNKEEASYLYSICAPHFMDCPSLNINNATAAEIAKFFRININKGKTFVKYRNSIGGFVKFEQINQVYGFSKLKGIDLLLKRIDLGRIEIQRFNLKNATYRTLLKHGFINRKSAVALNKLLKKRTLTLDDIRFEVSGINKPLVAYYFKE